MKDMFIITDSAFELSDFKLYAKDTLVFENFRESEIVHEILNDYSTYLSITLDNEIFNCMEPDVQEMIMSGFATFNIFMCMCNNFEKLQILVASIPADKKFIIDNDHGKVMTREEFMSINSYEDFVGDLSN